MLLSPLFAARLAIVLHGASDGVDSNVLAACSGWLAGVRARTKKQQRTERIASALGGKIHKDQAPEIPYEAYPIAEAGIRLWWNTERDIRNLAKHLLRVDAPTGIRAVIMCLYLRYQDDAKGQPPWLPLLAELDAFLAVRRSDRLGAIALYEQFRWYYPALPPLPPLAADVSENLGPIGFSLSASQIKLLVSVTSKLIREIRNMRTPRVPLGVIRAEYCDMVRSKIECPPVFVWLEPKTFAAVQGP